MTEQIPAGPGIATLVIAMPGTVRLPTDAGETMIRWLSAHGAPRTASVVEHLQREGWTIELAEPATTAQTKLIAWARFSDVDQARAAAEAYRGRVDELMRWAPVDSSAETVLLPVSDDVDQSP